MTGCLMQTKPRIAIITLASNHVVAICSTVQRTYREVWLSPPRSPPRFSPTEGETGFSPRQDLVGKSSSPHKGRRPVSPTELRGGECLPQLRMWGRTWNEFSPYLTSGGEVSPPALPRSFERRQTFKPISSTFRR